MKDSKDKTQEELNVLHSAVMAIEEILVKKGIVGIKELNKTIKQAHKECKTAKKKGKKPLIS
ncbi:MAG: hypothetical protein V1659_03950 [Candidatus Woesearchaeota archaeon]